jgi:predicted porin
MKKLLVTLMIAGGLTSVYAQNTARPNEEVTVPNAPVLNQTVNVYGLIDVGYIGTNYKGVGTNINTNQTTSQFGQNAESPSRIGIKGREDLGGGLVAFYTIETNINAVNATASTLTNRQSFVGLSKAGLGQASIGTQFTPIFTEGAATDASQFANLPGDVVWAGHPMGPAGNSGTAPYSSSGSTGSTSDAFTVRTSNTLNVASEKFKGFGGQAFYALNNQNTTQTSSTTGGTTNFGGYGLNANYTWNKLYVTAVYQALKSQVPGTLTTPAAALWSGPAGGVNTQDNQTYIAATYDFGRFKTFTQYINRQATSTLNSSYFTKRQAQQIGVRGNITQAVEAWASIGTGKISAFGASQPTANFIGYQVGSNYWLSKRTNLYAIYGTTNTSSASTNPSLSANGYGVGIRTVF